VAARFLAPVQTGPGAHLACCTIVTGSLSWLYSGRGVALTTHPLSGAEVKERVQPYFYSPLHLLGIFKSEIYIFTFSFKFNPVSINQVLAGYGSK